MAVKTEKELGKAIYDNVDEIEIEGDLAKKVIKIKAKGKVSWGVCIGSIAVAIALIIASTIPEPAEPVEIIGSGIALGFAGVTLGIGTASSAVAIGVAGALTAGGIGAAGAGVETLKKLRKYKIIKKTANSITLRK